MQSYFLVFSRIGIGLVFTLSAIGKLQGISAYKETLAGFGILPEWLIDPFAYAFLCTELVIVSLVILGGGFLAFGFYIAITLLAVFSVALLKVLIRNIQAPCNCFGASNQSISKYEVVRNLFFIGFSVLGLITSMLSAERGVTLSPVEIGAVGLMAATLVVVLIYGHEMTALIF